MQFPIQIVRPKSKRAYFGRKRLKFGPLEGQTWDDSNQTQILTQFWLVSGQNWGLNWKRGLWQKRNPSNFDIRQQKSTKWHYSNDSYCVWLIIMTHQMCNVRKLRRNYKKERKASACNHLVAVLIIFSQRSVVFHF